MLRQYRNLRPLGATGLTYSPGWAVGYCFIPILSLFRPYQAMRETWQASDPRHSGGTSWRLLAVPGILGGWWALFLISSVVNQVSFRVSMRLEDADVLLTFAYIDLFMLAFDTVLALVEIKLIRQLTDMQDARAYAPTAMPTSESAGYAGIMPPPPPYG